jgi:hypothetical protein
VVDGQGLPLGNYLDSASPAEVTLFEKTLSTIAVPRSGLGRPRSNPTRLIADRGYDSDSFTVLSGVSARQPEVPTQQALQSSSRQAETPDDTVPHLTGGFCTPTRWVGYMSEPQGFRPTIVETARGFRPTNFGPRNTPPRPHLAVRDLLILVLSAVYPCRYEGCIQYPT